MSLDSDIQNPDAALIVRFYTRAVENTFRTKLEGRPIFEDRDYVLIHIPGQKETVIDTFANDLHKQKYPVQWAQYQNNKTDDGIVNGTPLNAWTILSASQIEELRALKFFTVESIANASDQQLQRIQMIAGMQPHAFRDRAKRYLAAAKDEGYANAQAETAKKLEEENAKLKSDMEEMKAMIMELAKNQQKPAPKKAVPKAVENLDEEEGEAA